MLNVGELSALIPATQKNKDQFVDLNEIDAISRPVVDPQLRHTRANRLHVARIASGEALDANMDPRSRPEIPKSGEPGRELRRLPKLNR
jgi:hypothetical protein